MNSDTMKIPLVTISLLIVLTSLAGCNFKEKAAGPITYFDLKGFITSEIEQLEALDPKVSKKVIVNEEEEHQVLQNINWEKELSPFADADINKPVLVKMYDADTIFTDRERTLYSQITYVAKDDKLATKEMVISFIRNTGMPFKITIAIQRNNFLFRTKQNLELYAGHSYRIQTNQKILGIKESEFIVEAEILTAQVQ